MLFHHLAVLNDYVLPLLWNHMVHLNRSLSIFVWTCAMLGPSSFLMVLISPSASPINLLIPTSTRSLPVFSASNLTWSSQGMVTDLSFPLNCWMDPSTAWVNGCTEIFAENLSKVFNTIVIIHYYYDLMMLEKHMNTSFGLAHGDGYVWNLLSW